MGWPYTTQWYFDNGESLADGVAGAIGTATDAGSPIQLLNAHYTELAREGMQPYVGAYCMRVQLNGNAETAYITDADALLANTETNYVGFALYLSNDFALSGSNEIDIFAILDGAVLGSRVTLVVSSSTLRFQVSHEGDGTDDVVGTTYDVPLGEWMWVELETTIDTAGSLGKSTLYVTREGEKTATTVAATAGVTTIATFTITDGARIGVVTNAGTGNVGTLLFDAYHYHDPSDENKARINAPERRWSTTTEIHAPLHAFIGPGCIENLTMIGGEIAFDNRVVVYDTDRAQTDPDRIVAILTHSVENEVVDVSGAPIRCQNGAYVALYSSTTAADGADGTLVSNSRTGGNPTAYTTRAIIQMSPIVYGSRSRVIDYGLSRPPI